MAVRLAEMPRFSLLSASVVKSHRSRQGENLSRLQIGTAFFVFPFVLPLCYRSSPTTTFEQVVMQVVMQVVGCGFYRMRGND